MWPFEENRHALIHSTSKMPSLLIAAVPTMSMALVSLPCLIAREPALALPNQFVCRITTYYREAAMTTVVGTRTTCPGGHNTGHTYRYKEVDVVTLDTNPQGSSHTGGPGKLPCEFLATGCSNLPDLHH